ncbi:hypothetical protein, partial [Acinetobacter baumannii]
PRAGALGRPSCQTLGVMHEPHRPRRGIRSGADSRRRHKVTFGACASCHLSMAINFDPPLANKIDPPLHV